MKLVKDIRIGWWESDSITHLLKLPIEDFTGKNTAMCSCCGITQTVIFYKGKAQFRYCPYCGAEMKNSRNYIGEVD